MAGFASSMQNLRLAVKYLAGYALLQIEIGQLDSTIGISEIPFGNLTYWFAGSTLYLSINITQARFPPSFCQGYAAPLPCATAAWQHVHRALRCTAEVASPSAIVQL